MKYILIYMIKGQYFIKEFEDVIEYYKTKVEVLADKGVIIYCLHGFVLTKDV